MSENKQEAFIEDIRTRLLKEKEILEKKIQSKKLEMSNKAGSKLSNVRTAYSQTRTKQLRLKDKKNKEDINMSMLTATQYNSNCYLLPDTGTIRRKVKFIDTSKLIECKIKEQVHPIVHIRN